MKAALVKEKNVMVVDDIPIPQPSADSMLIKVHACAICGSDVRIYRRGDARARDLLRAVDGGLVDGGYFVKHCVRS